MSDKLENIIKEGTRRIMEGLMGGDLRILDFHHAGFMAGGPAGRSKAPQEGIAYGPETMAFVQSMRDIAGIVHGGEYVTRDKNRLRKLRPRIRRAKNITVFVTQRDLNQPYAKPRISVDPGPQIRNRDAKS